MAVKPESVPGYARPDPVGIKTTIPLATPAVTAYYSTFMLAAAEDAAVAAAESETRILAEGKRFSLEHRGHVLSAIVHTASFLEATINEILDAATDPRKPKKVANVDANTARGWKALWLALSDSGRALSRYQAALIVAGLDPFDEGAEPWQSAQLLVQVRNHLVHFRPETVSPVDPLNLSNRLKGRFEPNPLPGNHWDLDGWLGATCAEWAVKSARALVDDFATRTKAMPHYQIALDELRMNNP